MTVHDDEWDMPFARFGPTSSYNAPVVPPSVDPDGGTLVQIPCVAQEWLPVVLGALDQLRLPSTWRVADDDAMLLTLQRVANLRDIIAQWGPCEVLSFDCRSGVPSYSLDGGATWTALPACFTGPTGPAGATGSTGPAGGYTPPTTPPNPLGTAVDQLGCNIAGYLSNAVIQASMNQAVSSINAAQSDANFATALMGILFVADPIVDLVLLAGDALFHAITGGNLSDYNAAAADATLWSNVTCAIYSAIRTVGYVDATNYAAMLTNLAAVPYAHAEVVTSIHDYVATLGLTGIRQLQQFGAVATYDCSACSTPPSGVALALGTTAGWSYLASDLPSSGDFTVGGWWNGAALSSTQQVLFQMGCRTGLHNQITVFYTATNHYFSVYADNGAGGNLTLNSTVSVAGKHHLAMRKSGSTLSLWVDGVQVASGTLPAGNYQETGGAVSGWGGRTIDSRSCGAVIWRWAYYASALSNAAMLAWSTAGSFAPPPSGASHIWLYDENTGTRIVDSADSDDSTIFGNVTWTTHT